MKAGLRKISIKMVVRDDFDNDIIKKHSSVVSISEYEDLHIKHDDFLSNYTFEFLKDSAMQFGQGIWMVFKGFAGMASWSVVAIVESLKHMWKFAFDKKDDKKEEK